MSDIDGVPVTIRARGAGKTAEQARVVQASIDSACAEAYSRGWLNGVTDILEELARAKAVTSTGGKRTVARIRKRLELADERPAWLSDTVPTPPTEAPDA